MPGPIVDEEVQAKVAYRRRVEANARAHDEALAARFERELDEFERHLIAHPSKPLSTEERLAILESGGPDPSAKLSNAEWSRDNRLKNALRVRLVERGRRETEEREQADGTARKRDQYDERKRAIE